MPLRSAIEGPAAEVRTFRVWPSLGHPRIYARRNHYEYRSGLYYNSGSDGVSIQQPIVHAKEKMTQTNLWTEEFE
jgi:hypothetical protein